ncbi:MAG: KGK domain-containing protein [Nostocaceae cyanobacterium]|nr:KGK domain-containing protein [Nostocaceae cyanobacterium]
MNNKAMPLNSDDVILLQKDSFTISRLKELIHIQLRNKLARSYYDSQTQKPEATVLALFSQLNIGEEELIIAEIQYNLLLDCQILKVDNGGGWQKGQLKIQASISPSPKNQKPDTFIMEFYPATAPVPASV